MTRARCTFDLGVIDFEPYRRKEKTLQDLAEGLGRQDLARLTDHWDME